MHLVHEFTHDKLRAAVNNETLVLRTLCRDWIKEISNTKLPEDVIGEISVATGQSELLIQERFSQFSNLLDDSEFRRSEKEITLDDLQGFWDIIFLQVENVKNKFEKLSKLKRNKWMSPLASLPDNPQTLKAKPSHFTGHNKAVKSQHIGMARSGIRDHILAQRKKLKLEAGKDEGAKKTMADAYPREESKGDKENVSTARSRCPLSSVQPEEAVDVKRFEAGFFEIHTPIRKASNLSKRIPNPDSSPALTPPKVLASSVLKKRIRESPLLHKDYSPCMRITRSMKKSLQRQRELQKSSP